MDKKTIIHEFDPQIYPRFLWVVKGGSLEGIKETLDIGDYQLEGSEGAITIVARKKEDDQLGALVWFPSPKDIKKGAWAAHECAHVALYMYNEIGASADFENQEPFAYLVGWIFECIETVQKIKEVKNGSTKSKSVNGGNILP